VALKGQDAGLREYVVGKVEFLHETKEHLRRQKDGWHDAETDPSTPARTCVDSEGSHGLFQNPKRTSSSTLKPTQLQELPETARPDALIGKSGVVIPIADSDVLSQEGSFPCRRLG